MKKNEIVKIDGLDVIVTDVESSIGGKLIITYDKIGLKDKLLVKCLNYLDTYCMALNREQRELLHEIELIRKSFIPKN
jgi:hypothetical protein